MTEVDVVQELPAWLRVIITVASVLVATFVINFVARRVISRSARKLAGGAKRLSSQQRKRADTITVVLRALVTTVLWAVGIMVALSQSGVDIGPLLATAGVGGIAIGFGAQNVVRDFLAGIFVLLEDQYHVGDVIEIAGVVGYVEKVTLRTTTMRDIDGRVHMVPNGEVRVTTNHTKGYGRYLLDLPVAYDEDVDAIVDLVQEVLDEMRKEPEFGGAILGPLEVLGVDQYLESYVILRMYVDTLPGEQWRIGRDLRRRLTTRYQERGVTVPYPRSSILIRDPRPGEA